MFTHRNYTVALNWPQISEIHSRPQGSDILHFQIAVTWVEISQMAIKIAINWASNCLNPA